MAIDSFQYPSLSILIQIGVAIVRGISVWASDPLGKNYLVLAVSGTTEDQHAIIELHVDFIS
jgi:hypothetical protein